MLPILLDTIERHRGRVTDCAAGAAALVSRAARHVDRVRRDPRTEPLPRRPLVAVAAATICGCAAGAAATRLAGPGAASGTVATCWTIAAALAVAWVPAFRAGRTVVASRLLLAAVVVAAAGWSFARERLFAPDDLAWSLSPAPVPVAFEGTVVESPRLLPPSSSGPHLAAAVASRTLVAVSSVRDGAVWKPASGRALVTIDGQPPRIATGSVVRILGRGLRPGPAPNPGDLDGRSRARSDRCLSLVRCQSADCVTTVRPASPWSVAAWLDRARTACAAALASHVGARAPLAATLLLGTRESLPGDESRDFLVTGTVHILSISGLHVGILAWGLFRALRTAGVPRRPALTIVPACTGLYMAFVGAETPVVRATLLVWLTCLGAALGRRSPALNALAVAAIIVLVRQPSELYRVGTQLSFLSTAVLIGAGVFAPSLAASADPIERLVESSRGALERRLRRCGRQVAGVAITGAAIWTATSPLVAAQCHVVSPIGLVLNPLLAPLVPLAMAWGILCLVAAPVSGPLADGCGAACAATLAAVEWLVAWAAALPGAYGWVAGPPAWWIAGGYALAVCILLALPQARVTRLGTWAAAIALWSIVGLGARALEPLWAPRPVAVEVTVAALGHGCGVVVRGPSGRVLVYDAGRLGAPHAARRSMSAVLWSQGIGRIDTLVISHADTDHFNAVPDLLERFAVGELAVSAPFLRSASASVGQLVAEVRARRIPVRVVGSGAEIPFDPWCRVRVLHHDAAAASDNETSLVLAVEAAGRTLLLTGDLEGPALDAFVARGPAACDILLAPHHGSATSLPAAIAVATRPDWVVVSGPGGSRWLEVERAYATARGAGRPTQVVRTGGAVRLRLTAGGVAVRQFREGRWQDVAADVRPAGRSPVASARRPRPGARSSG